MPNENPLRYLILLSVCFGTPVLAEVVFTDVTAASGLGLPEAITHSVSWGDYDDDGDLDVYLTVDGTNRLFRNDGNGQFTERTQIAEVHGPGSFASVGTAMADMDNDGDLDIYVNQVNTFPDQFYRNDGPIGDGGEVVFTDITSSAGTTIDRSARGMIFVDYNRDSLLDIYVLASGGTIMYKNMGNMQFVDVAPALGIAQSGRDVGVVATDIDNNGWPDLFVANRSGDPTNLYLNINGEFTDIAASAGIDATGLGMGVSSLDYDNDLDFDLYWSTWPGDGAEPVINRFYENNGDLTFSDVTTQTGTADPLGWGVSTDIGDIDNDGFMDLFVTNGVDPSSTPSVLFHNNGDGTFSERAEELLGITSSNARGVAFVDFDDDGDEDLFVTSVAGISNRLYRNDTTDGNHWLKLRLKGGRSNSSAVGSRVEVTSNVRTTVQELDGGVSRGNHGSLELIFGLGTATQVDQVKINWPSGQVQILKNLAIDQAHTIFESGPQNHNYSGSWSGTDLDQAGHGFSLEELANNTYVAYWYFFDNQGNRHWVIVPAGVRQMNVVSGTAYTVEGGFFPPMFDAASTTVVEFGLLEFTFFDCITGLARWTPSSAEFESGEMPISKLSQLSNLGCK